MDAGDIVTVDVRGNNEEIVIKKAKKVTLPSGISPDFMDTLSQVIEQYDETIKGLKDR